MRTKGALPLSVPEIEQAKALSALGRSYRAIGRELHRSAHTIKRALTSSGEVVAQVRAIKADLADTFEGLAVRMVGSISDADIAKLDAYKRTLSGAIATDKFKLLRGEPTEILGVQVLLDVAALLRREERQADDEGWQQAHTLPAPTPAPIALSAPAPLPAPVQRKAELQPAAPRIRYQDVRADPIIDERDENPLMRGLPSR